MCSVAQCGGFVQQLLIISFISRVYCGLVYVLPIGTLNPKIVNFTLDPRVGQEDHDKLSGMEMCFGDEVFEPLTFKQKMFHICVLLLNVVVLFNSCPSYPLYLGSIVVWCMFCPWEL